MNLTSQQLLEEAEKRELNLDERRQAIMYVMHNDPSRSGRDLARLFNVSEATIRKDKTLIRQKYADDLREADPVLVIADAKMLFDRQVRDIEKSKLSADPGTKDYLKHCTDLIQYQIKMLELYQTLGFLPKNVGALANENYDYAAIVRKDGSVTAQPVNRMDEEDLKELKQQRKISQTIEMVPVALPEPETT